MKVEIDLEKIRQDSIALLLDVKGIFERNDITWWLDQGSALGVAREHDFIPWDDDIDISVWRDEINASPDIWKEFERAGYNVFNYRRCETFKLETRKRELGWRSVDIHIYHKEGARGVMFFNGPKHPVLLRLLFDAMKPIDMVWEMKRGPDIGLKNIKEQLKSNQGAGLKVEMEVSTPCSENSAILNNIIRVFAKLLPESFLFLLKHALSQIRLTVCSFPLRTEVPLHFLENLNETDFLGLKVIVPTPLEQYVSYKFGENWREPRPDWVDIAEDGALVNPLSNMTRR